MGAHVAFQRGVRNELGQDRVRKGLEICERIRWAPLPMHARTQLLSSLVMPSTLYGYCVGGLSCNLLDQLTSAIMRAVWGTKRKLRSKEVVLSLLVPGHLVDPKQASIYQCLRMLRRQLQKNPGLHHVVAHAWNCYVNDAAHTPGPVGLVFKVSAALGWTWASVDAFQRPGRCDLPLCEGPDTWWDHEVREVLRLAMWAQAAKKRKDMKGLDASRGLDRAASLALLQQSKGVELGVLRSILAGSARLQQRLFEASLVDSPLCQFCHTSPETLQHCFWNCMHWAPIRDKHGMSRCDELADWPMCTQECGLFLEDERVLALQNQLLEEEKILATFQSHFGLQDCRETISANEPMIPQVVWTDGASSNNQDSRFRRAGSGIFYGPGHLLNFSCMLPGLSQSNQRAELFAVLVACLRDPRPLHIRTDSEWVCRGFDSWRTWVADGWRGDHADLWNLLANELSCRSCDVNISWVKGHATCRDVQMGRTTSEDKAGNDSADKLARAGAAAHHVPSEVVKSAQDRRQLAKRTQKMMVSILMERQRQEHSCQDEGPDRGSEAGDDDCMEFCMCMNLSDTEHLHDSGTETPCACACLNLLVPGTDLAQEDSPEDTFDVEGVPNVMHVHDVQTNSLDDEFDDGFDQMIGFPVRPGVAHVQLSNSERFSLGAAPK